MGEETSYKFVQVTLAQANTNDNKSTIQMKDYTMKYFLGVVF